MKRRNLLIALGASALAAPFASYAQQPAKVARIGFLSSVSASGYASRVEALRAGLRDLGYVEGKNVVIEFRWAEGNYDRLPVLAAELVRLKVDVLVAQSTYGAHAARKATATIPIVMVAVGDPVASGLVASLAQPGANITGSASFAPELAAKRLELLKELIPRITQVAVLLNQENQDNVLTKPTLEAMERAAKLLKLGLQQFSVRGPTEFESAFAAIVKKRPGALAVFEESMININRKAIAELAAKHRLPSIGNKDFAEAGGLIGYGVNFPELYRRAAIVVDKILKGAKPGDIPVERATRFELIANLNTARSIGIKIPDWLLQRADKVIE